MSHIEIFPPKQGHEVRKYIPLSRKFSSRRQDEVMMHLVRVFEEAPEIMFSLSGDESGWCSDVASTHGAWRHAGVRFLLRRDFALDNIVWNRKY